ncbi:CoA-transferase [Seohaeicola zhoushanensis]
MVELALRCDVALIHAARADTFGNLAFAATARNFAPLIAMAADMVIAEAEEIVPLGALPRTMSTPPAPSSTMSSRWRP